MPNLIWSKLNHLQLGKYAEYCAKMEFTSYGLEVYTSEVDDHGVDFIVKDKRDIFYEVQVKSIRKTNYAFIPKSKIKIDDRHIVCLLRFSDGAMPEMYVFPATVWNKSNAVFVNRNYEKNGKPNKPEWGINYSKKNINLLLPYKAEITLGKLADFGN